jgi:hypothetical protein
MKKAAASLSKSPAAFVPVLSDLCQTPEERRKSTPIPRVGQVNAREL